MQLRFLLINKKNEYKVTPALPVPPHIKRPEWVSMHINYNYSNIIIIKKKILLILFMEYMKEHLKFMTKKH